MRAWIGSGQICGSAGKTEGGEVARAFERQKYIYWASR
jgi:hypothetical protein